MPLGGERILRASSRTDLQGIAPPDPDQSPDASDRISRLGSWGEWVVANNPHAPAELQDRLARSDDAQVRAFVFGNQSTAAPTRARLASDPIDEIRQALR